MQASCNCGTVVDKVSTGPCHQHTFSSEEFKQYQIELQTSLSNKEKQLSYAL